MIYTKITNGVVDAYPYTLDRLRSDFPDTSFPANLDLASLAAFGVFPVHEPDSLPNFNTGTQRLEQGNPKLVNGKWTKDYIVVEIPEVDRKAAQDAHWDAIKQVRERKGQLGGYLVAGKWFHSDLKSQTQQLGLARKADRIEAAGGNMNTPFPGPGPGGILVWKTMDGSWVPMTPLLAQQIFAAAEAQDLALFAHAESLRVQGLQVDNPFTVDVEAGWPATYQGI